MKVPKETSEKKLILLLILVFVYQSVALSF